ncbi:major capsid protein E [Nitrosomonas oligotropha]|uniref:Major capsid protein E n=1 Tax=Nitrosomonas oligotropha TaxID=42354 RepID=A0A2T5HGZ7_9PROT|nr:major capsid protein [Nitrosomonas oligotropha]PTQ70842.1 major capsid protein E [Nitrosomonas oligotropha]
MTVTYDTDTLLGVQNSLDSDDTFLLDLFFPNIVTFDTSSISFDKVDDDGRLAPYVSPMVAGKVMKAKGQVQKKFTPAYLKPKDVVDPERVLIRRAGEEVGGRMSPEQRRRIRRRLEHMAAQVLLQGKITVSGEDYPTVEVDYERTVGNTIVLTLGARWGEATATPLDDIEAWGALSEAPINTLVMDRKAYRNFVKNPDVQKLLDGRRNSRSELETGPNNGRLFSYKGTVGSDIEVWVYSGYYRDEAGNKVNYLPDNTVIAGSAAIDGVRAFGAILDPVAGYQALEMFPKNWISDDPAAEFIMTQSAPLLIPRRPNASIAVTVR